MGKDSGDDHASRVGMWNGFYASEGNRRRRGWYGVPTTMKLAAKFLNMPEIVTVEDWGCGFGGFRRFLAKHQEYVGVDGSESPGATVNADLTQYRSEPDGLLLRHVLEHNPDWSLILDNALASFERRMVLIIFTPFLPETKEIRRYRHWHGCENMMVDIGFRKEEITDRFGEAITWTEKRLKTRSQYRFEHLFYLEK
jgi:hypothetical protein